MWASAGKAVGNMKDFSLHARARERISIFIGKCQLRDPPGNQTTHDGSEWGSYMAHLNDFGLEVPSFLITNYWQMGLMGNGLMTHGGTLIRGM